MDSTCPSALLYVTHRAVVAPARFLFLVLPSSPLALVRRRFRLSAACSPPPHPPPVDNSSGSRRLERCASTRKSGMTILGKVPKPINLPSQRLENNGVDPNVEIVPKGSLTWGNRPSSASTNVWSSSTLLSPKTDGSSGSPSHYSGRPSSGGSGTRPSTAGSDRSQDPSPNAWGSNLRPLTASGSLPSNQTPMAARPQSAETRPGSSHLSRFAEHSADPAVAWGPTRTAEKFGGASSKTDKFSLSSGDFPTLGSDKKSETHSQQDHSSQEHHAATSGKFRPNIKVELSSNEDGFMDRENVNTLRTNRNLYAEGGARLNMNCQNNPQQAQPSQSLKTESHQFDSWHGPPVHPADGIWYRGGTIGGPYQPAAPRGSFPIEPFVCCPFPPNSEAVLRPGAGPANYYPTNGETYHPQMLPNSYMFPSHPGVPSGPGPYQAPPYDGFYNYHQTSIYSSGGQQFLSAGMATQPSVYNQHSNHLQEEQFTPANFDVKRKPGIANSMQKGEQSTVSRKNETVQQAPSKPANNCECQTSTPVMTNLQKNPCGTSSGTLKREPDTVVPMVHDQKHNPVIKKNSVLIEKIEGLTNKVRNATSFTEIGQVPSGQEGAKQPKIVNAKPEHSAEVNAAHTENASTSIIAAKPVSFEESSSDFPTPSTTAMPVPSKYSSSTVVCSPKLSVYSAIVSSPEELQDIDVVKPDYWVPDEAAYFHVPNRIHVTQSRGDYPDISRSDNQVDTGSARKPSGRGPSAFPKKLAVDGPVTGILDNNPSKEAILSTSSDSIDHKVQHAKVKEIAVQCTKQLQKEEERTREQKAKALAKLEEPNRRSVAQNMKQKLNSLSRRSNVQHQENSGVDISSQTNVVTSNPPGDIVGNTETLGLATDSENKKHGTLVALHLNSASITPREVSQDSAIFHGPPLDLQHETNTTDVTNKNFSTESHVGGVSKHKQMGYRRRQKVPLEKSSDKKPIMMENVDSEYLDETVLERSSVKMPISTGDKVISENSSEGNTPAAINKLLNNEDPSLQHKKKSSRNPRNKNKDDILMSSSLISYAHSDENVEEHLCESSQPRSPASVAETLLVPAQVAAGNAESQDSKDGIHSHQVCPKIIKAHGRMSNQWKPHAPRRPARNQQVHRPMDKAHGSETVVWAPIKPPNKNEQYEESSQSGIGSDHQSSERNEHDMNGTRTKRAEMERYVPRPVAKELLQQENRQKSSSDVNQSGDMPEKPCLDSKGAGMSKSDGSSGGRTDIIADKKNRENKRCKQGMAHASWRQRSSTESTLPLQSLNEGLNSSDATKLFDKPSDQHLQLPEQFGPESSRNSVSKDSVVLPVVTKDQGKKSRQRHQQVHRDAGSNYVALDHHHLPSETDDRSGVNTPILVLNDTDGRTSMAGDGKNIGGEHHIRTHSHWKPKSRPYSRNQKQENRDSGGQRISCHNGTTERFTSPGSKTDHSRDDGSHVVMGADNDVPPGNRNAQVSPPHQRGDHNGHFNRVQEAIYKGKDLAQVSGKLNAQINEDRPENNAHLEYKPIGSSNEPSDLCQPSFSIDQGAQVHRVSKQRYKEQVQNQTRKCGHFFKQNTSATAHVGEE
ncbi:protein MODIFIER OF SNC1 [Musa troglodytarum]|uniref:Protein MODIFIER OF SNC1 n=1 Tax=Musa troglodytarum TaxID=320322 RepID=A0A9E7KCP4_9LILI|nr:protein MODIFIER OF SNC1 [Musa troglodytarum]